ncbi:hypothetical protein ACE38V_20320 [Cytobacillus sp. Hz8]|uniref:hypothetical protein n=1 Tax=Cytobacillus sp. Hz8 TaxID=3347168 RepID=UPI0035DC5AB4
MQNYEYYSPEVHALLMNYSNEKVAVLYNSNPQPFLLPTIGKRPPFYCHPKYEQYYPVI